MFLIIKEPRGYYNVTYFTLEYFHFNVIVFACSLAYKMSLFWSLYIAVHAVARTRPPGFPGESNSFPSQAEGWAAPWGLWGVSEMSRSRHNKSKRHLRLLRAQFSPLPKRAAQQCAGFSILSARESFYMYLCLCYRQLNISHDLSTIKPGLFCFYLSLYVLPLSISCQTVCCNLLHSVMIANFNISYTLLGSCPSREALVNGVGLLSWGC